MDSKGKDKTVGLDSYKNKLVVVKLKDGGFVKGDFIGYDSLFIYTTNLEGIKRAVAFADILGIEEVKNG